MKTNKKLIIGSFSGAFILSLILAGCGNGRTSVDPFVAAKFNAYDSGLGKRIEAYQNNIILNGENGRTGNPSLYIDFSSGINKAFADPGIKAMMTNCFNTILAQKFDVYKLGSGEITPLNVTNTTQLGQRVGDAMQYVDIWAPIQAAVEQIVEGNNDALLITDFEEWQKNIEITNTAFLKIPFSKWLEKGNTIHFFIADYNESGLDKHLYFTVFSYGHANERSMLSKLEAQLATRTTRFDLSTKPYTLRTGYSGEKSGGIFYDESGKSDQARNVLDLKDNYINGLKNGTYFEFYPLGLDWKTIGDLHATYSGQGEFNDFFRRLYIDLSQDDSYKLEDFTVKVTDVANDFEHFSKCEEANRHKPKMNKGVNGETKFADNENDPIALECYNIDGSLKEKWVYKPQSGAVLNEVFILNKSLFDNTKKSNNKNVELGVSFDPKFNVKNIQDPNGLVKVDIVLNTAIPNLTGAKLSKFQWVNAKHISNTALYESVKNTLQELKPVNQIVYSYYIKTQ